MIVRFESVRHLAYCDKVKPWGSECYQGFDLKVRNFKVIIKDKKDGRKVRNMSIMSSAEKVDPCPYYA